MSEKDTTGIFTVEGNVAGSAALKMAKQREKQMANFAQQKQEMEEKGRVPNIQDVNARFKKETISNVAKEYKKQTYGLKTRDEFVRLKELEKSAEPLKKKGLSKRERKRMKREKKRLKKQKLLSFNDDDGHDDHVDDTLEIAHSIVKDPSVRTDFLPDRERDVQRKKKEEEEAKRLEAVEEEAKKEKFTVKFSLYDGTDHAYQVTMKKDQTVMDFLNAVREECIDDFPELKKHAAIDLMYVKNNLILPTSMQFFELMKLRTKVKPLFQLSKNNETTEGLVCLRFWYDRHKHIYPADRWESYHDDKVYRIEP